MEGKSKNVSNRKTSKPKNPSVKPNAPKDRGTQTKKATKQDYEIVELGKKKRASSTDKAYEPYSMSPEESIEKFKRVKKLIDAESMNVKKKKKKSKRKSKVKVVVWTSIIALFSIIIVSVILMFTLPVFNLKNVELNVESRYNASEIAEHINLNMNENIFIAMFKSNRKNIRGKCPYIESLRYVYKFPNTIKLNIVEREKRYYTFNKENSKYYLLDKNGYILEELNDSSNWQNEILVSGVTFENNVILGEKLNDIDLKRLEKFEKFYDSLMLNLENCNITRVTFVNEYMKIYINSSIEVVFESRKDISDYNMAMIKLIMKDVEGQNGTIDMTRQDPTFVKN